MAWKRYMSKVAKLSVRTLIWVVSNSSMWLGCRFKIWYSPTVAKKWVMIYVAALAFDNAHDVIVSKMAVHNNSGLGLHANQVLGNVQVYESAFLYNSGNKKYYGGNVCFRYGECPQSHNTYLNWILLLLTWLWYIQMASFFLWNCSWPHIADELSLDHCNITAVRNETDNGGNIGINLTNISINYHYSDKPPSVIINNSRIACGTGCRGGGSRVGRI